MRGFYPQLDFPDKSAEWVLKLSKELRGASYAGTGPGITIRRPQLHAAGVELGILASQSMMKNKNWTPGPPVLLVLALGYEKACEWSGWRKEGTENRAAPESPIKK